MKKVTKSQFKPRAFEYLRMVEEEHESLVVTDYGRDAVRIEPVGESTQSASGVLSGTIVSWAGPDQPVSESDWEALR